MQATIRRIYEPFIRVATVSNTIGTVVIFLLVAIMNVDVIARGVFHAPLRGVVELVIFSLILIVFLQLPDVVRHNRLTRSDGFLQIADSIHPRLRDVLNRMIDLSAGIFMALAAWIIWPEAVESVETCQFMAGDLGFLAEFAEAWSRCEYFGTPGIFTAPWWPVKLAVAFSLTLCAIIFLFKVLIGVERHDTSEAAEADR